jgi:hypothetical protein
MTTNEIPPDAVPDEDAPRDYREAVLTDLMREWWQPPPALISTLPGRGGGPALSYLGHADTTRALIEADPLWTWEPMGYDEHGQPFVERDERGNPVGLWCWLTVCGVTRPAYGSCQSGKTEAVKELIGDAIRNGAMRFGVAGALWSKADREGDGNAAKPQRRKAARRGEPTGTPRNDLPGTPDVAPGTAELQALMLLAADGTTPEQVAACLTGAGIEGRAALTDQPTYERAQAAVREALGPKK